MTEHDSEHEELLALRAEVSRLRAGRWRAPLSITLIILGCVLAPVSVVGVWAATEVTNTDRYVHNMAPLIGEPAVQAALTTQITSAIMGKVNVQGLAGQAASELSQHDLPRMSTLVQNFSGQITDAVSGFVHSAVARAVASPAMTTAWVQTNRTAHAELVKVLSGQGSKSVNVTDGKVTLSLGPLITQALQYLGTHGLSFVSKIPAPNPTFTLFTSPELSKAQAGYRLVSTLKWVLPMLALVLLTAGILVARRTRRALAGAGLGLAASMLVLGVALAIARVVYLNSVPQSVLPSDAAGVLYDALIRFLRESLRVLIVIGLVVALGAYLTGLAPTAVRIRGAFVRWFGWLRSRGPATGPVGAWIGTYKNVLRVGAVALAALIFVFSLPATLTLVIWLVVVLLLLLALIEVLGAPAHAPE